MFLGFQFLGKHHLVMTTKVVSVGVDHILHFSKYSLFFERPAKNYIKISNPLLRDIRVGKYAIITSENTFHTETRRLFSISSKRHLRSKTCPFTT